MEATQPRRLRSRSSPVDFYRPSPRMAYLAACLYPGSIIAPSTLAAGALSIPRFFLFIAALAVVRELWRKITRGGFVLIATDVIVPMMALWMLAAIFINEGAKALVGSAALAAVEFLIAYFLARSFFGNPAGFAQFVRVMRFVTVVILGTALLDTVSGRYVVSQFGVRIAGGMPAESFPMRFGLVRAMGSLEHPILMGTFFVICAIIFFHSKMIPTQKFAWIFLCIFGALLPLSSAPLLSLLMTIGILIYLHMSRSFPWRMLVMSCAAIFALGAFVVLVDDPLTTLIQNLTYDPQTGMFRVLIWQWVGLNIERAPWIGIGLADWMRSPEMPSSIDSLYLIQSIRYGLPALALLFLAILSTGFTMSLKARPAFPSETVTTIRRGMAIAIFIYTFNAFTVHFWGSAWTMLAVMIGIRAGSTEAIFLSPAKRGDAITPPDRLEPSPLRLRHGQTA